MNATVNIDPKRQESLKTIIMRLHAGEKVATVRKDFARLIEGVSAEEIAAMEQALVDGGLPVEEIQRLCEVHVDVFKTSLEKGRRADRMPGHPVHTFLAENREAELRLRRLLSELSLAKRFARGLAWGGGSPASAKAAFEDVASIVIHYQRKENQLFPWLEKKGFTGPSKVMWGKHDEVRAQLKLASQALAAASTAADSPAGPSKPDRGAAEREAARRLRRECKKLAGMMRRMFFMEERILFPTALAKLDDRDWALIRKGEDAIGWAWTRPGAEYDAAIVLAQSSNAPSLSELIAAAKPGAYDEVGTVTGAALGTVTGAQAESGTVAGAALGTVTGAQAESGTVPGSMTVPGSSPETMTVPGSVTVPALPLDTGALPLELLNLVLKKLPVDISVVDEEDRVLYYSDNPGRVFPRSPGVIGRDVRNCHPPKSLAIVQKILDDFREGRRDSARFWIQMGPRFVVIDYLALRDAEGRYRGTLEMTQDASELRALEGQRRLLD